LRNRFLAASTPQRLCSKSIQGANPKAPGEKEEAKRREKNYFKWSEENERKSD